MKNGRYLVLFDPLDGSSNIDVNISVGTIFSILPKPEGRLDTASFLQSGENQAAAGYVLYGPQTQLVITFKHGVYVFTLNEGGDFVLTQQEPKVPVHLRPPCWPPSAYCNSCRARRFRLPKVRRYTAGRAAANGVGWMR